MKILFTSLFIATTGLLGHSQSNVPATAPTFWDVQNAFEQESEKNGMESSEKDGEWNQFKRWESFMKLRTYPQGIFPNPEAVYLEYRKLKAAQSSLIGEKVDAANWTFKGPGNVPTGGGGSGRVNCLEFDPSNPAILWAGAACGGLWKSTDAGMTWAVSGTDLLPSLSISDIAIDPTNSQTMYLATGDKYGIYFMLQTWGQYSAGVLKSTDGGATWNPTGFNYALANGVIIQRLVISHANPQVLLAATLNGLYRTADGGATWTSVNSGKYYDLEIHPTNSNILYAADSAKIFRSTDAGLTWTFTGINANGRSSIAVTTGFPNVIYIWANGAIYYSNDSGVNFAFRNDPTTSCNPVGYYDRVLEVSSGDENVLLAGGVEVGLSTDGGVTWTQVSSSLGFGSPNYIHADQKAFRFVPGSSNTAYLCNDGGVFKTTDQATTFVDRSNGIDIKQYYRMASSQQNPAVMFGGSQDNGTDRITGPTTSAMCYGYDGEDCLVDHTNDNIVFASTQGGSFKRSTNGGIGFSNIPVTGCDWTSPIAMDPNDHNIVYVGASNMRKSVNNGVTWASMPGTFDGQCIYSIEVAKSNSSYIYIASFGHIYRTTNGGTSWSDITGTLPVGSAGLSNLTMSTSNPDHVWVCFSGFSAANKIFQTTDGGATWTNISTGIPNVPVNCIEYQQGSNDFVYAGTDLGVFFKDTSSGGWVSFGTGMPNVIINELEMYYPTKKIRAATYGRGIWESDFHDSTSNPVGVVYQELPGADVFVSPNPSSGIFFIHTSGSDVGSVEVYNVIGKQVYNGENSQRIDISMEPAGIYFVKIRTNSGIRTEKIVLRH